MFFPQSGWKHVQTISFFQFHFQLQFQTKTKKILINQFLFSTYQKKKKILFSSLWAIPQSPSNLSKPLSLPLDLTPLARVMTTLSFPMTRPFSSRCHSLTPRLNHGFTWCEPRPSRSDATIWGSGDSSSKFDGFEFNQWWWVFFLLIFDFLYI